MSESKQPVYKKWWVWVIGIVAVIALATQAGKDEKASEAARSEPISEEVSTSTSTSTQPVEEVEPEPETILSVSATQYYKDYESNELAADQKYENQKLEITGEVDAVEKSFGSLYVKLKGTEFLGTVSCKLEDESGAASLSKGNMVTLVGLGDGKMGFPRVRNCSIK